MGHWKEYDTTADTGLEVFGDSLEDLFITAALAFTEMSTNPKSLGPGNVAQIVIECGTDEPDMMLQEMLHHFVIQLDAWFQLPLKILELRINKNIIEIDLLWGKWLDGESESRTEIKAVTYHELCVDRLETGEVYGRVVFDI
jgi:SHS2 domain-containing protein